MTRHICTSGTSIGGGPMRDNDIDAYRHATAERVARFREAHGDGTGEFLAKVSAETNSLSKIGLQAGDRVILLCTDTEDGAVCAEAVAKVLEKDRGAATEIRRIEGLQVTEAQAFARQGIPRLFDTLNKVAGEGARYEGVRLNATGGFKSVVPFLTLYGLMERLPVDYLFERSNTPLSLPPAPVDFNYDLLRYAEPALRALSEEAVVSRKHFAALLEGLDYEDRDFLTECLTESDGDSVIASPWAELLLRSEATHAADIYLGPHAQEVLDQADGAIRPYLEDLLIKAAGGLWRKSHRHAFQGSDLETYKPGNVGQRLAGVSKPGKLYVCELYTNHAAYEKDLPNRQQAHYSLDAFKQWAGPAQPAGTDSAPGQERQHQQQLAQIQTLEHERSQFQEQVAAQKAKVEQTRRERDEDIAAYRREFEQAIEEEVHRQRETTRAEIARLRQELDQARQAQQAIRETVPPWYRRLGAVFSPSLWF